MIYDTLKLILGIYVIYKHHSNELPPKMIKITVNKTKKMFSDCAIRNCIPFWNSPNKTVKRITDLILGHVWCVLSVYRVVSL